MNVMLKHLMVLAVCVAIVLSASAYSCALYHVEVERQETVRMEICLKSGGNWVTAWNWKTYCKGDLK